MILALNYKIYRFLAVIYIFIAILLQIIYDLIIFHKTSENLFSVLSNGLAHTGVKYSVKLITEKFVWPNIKKNIALLSKTCIAYQQTKVSRHASSSLKSQIFILLI